MSKVILLHLSDFHINADEERFDMSLVLDPLKKRLETDVKNGLKPDVLVITGDITSHGKKKEYNQALEIIQEIATVVGLDNKDVILIPGNHDVDRTKVLKGYLVESFPLKHWDEILQDGNQRKLMLNGQTAYKGFASKNFPHLQPSNQYLFFNHLKRIRRKNITFTGLNSAWMTIKDLSPGTIVMSEYQIKHAFDPMNETKGPDLRIVLMHHPNNWLHYDERSRFLYTYLPSTIPTLILSGHIHETEFQTPHPNENNILSLGAGAAYDSSSFRNAFQWIVIDFDEKTVASHGRCYDAGTREWSIDCRNPRNDNGIFVKEGILEKKEMQRKKKERKTVEIPLEIPESYRIWIEDFHSTMSLEQLARKGEVLTISLPEVYIPIETGNPFHKIELDEIRKRHSSKKSRKEPEISPDEMDMKEECKEPSGIDIEELLGRINCILLQGGAGMGKTTLIKHLAYTITHGMGKPSFQGYIPVIIFLKDLWPIYQDRRKATRKKISFEMLLKEYLDTSTCPLSYEVVKNYFSNDTALFLLDGLDEIPEKHRDVIVEILAGFQFGHKNNRYLITGRPHGIAGKATERFGKNLHEIEYLDEEKVRYFIRKWFPAVAAQAKGVGKSDAEDMISDMGLHEHVQIFTRIPLLLTAVCILYWDGKRIPEQRAELYDRIIGNLLWRRFHDAQDDDKITGIKEYLMLLAYRMMEKNLKTFESSKARDILKDIYPRKDGEEKRLYNRRLDTLFDEIEPDCGLLKRLDDGELEFFHLSFQEFMAAKHMNYMEIDHSQYLGQTWWEETILLFLGFMNLDRKEKSNSLVREILQTKKRNPKEKRYLWLLASKALRDFPPKKRVAKVVALGREKLLSVIDSKALVGKRFEAGELLGLLGDLRDLKQFITIPAGKYAYQKKVIPLETFELSKYPVTNSWFREFVDAKGYDNPDYWDEEGWKNRKDNKITEPEYWHDRKWNVDNFPVVGVSWYEAKAFCNWLNTQHDGCIYNLPTAEQWEAAARGKEGREYPWGKGLKKDDDLCNYGMVLGRTSPVGIFPKGDTKEGLSDMAGNVDEWCEDPYDDDGSIRVLRGGSWNNTARFCTASFRGGDPPASRYDGVGFRLARSRRTDEAPSRGAEH